ncbi:MAG: efflux RND transporter periplasmic adaptor subunit [Christensenellales bacterium]
MTEEISSFTEKKAQAKRKKKMKMVIWCIAAALLIGGGIYGYTLLQSSSAEASTSILTYRVTEVTEGNVTTSISGSGTITPVSSQTVAATYAGTVKTLNKKVGDTVTAGESIGMIQSDELEAQLDTLRSSLDSLKKKLASTDSESSSRYITASVAGTVKLMKAKAGDQVQDVTEKEGYLCVISTDGKMQVSFSVPEGLKKYDEVLVRIGEDEEDGKVASVTDGVATVQIEENGYAVGAAATVLDAEGTKTLGEGTLALADYVEITADDGVVYSVLVEDNDTVYRNGKLFKLTDYPTSTTYISLKEQIAEAEDQIEDLENEQNIIAQYDCVIIDLPVAGGTELAPGDTVVTMEAKAGYEISITVDELDIASVSLGQAAVVTLDALDGEFKGTVSYISHEGTVNNSVTTYSVTVSTEAIEGALPGMSASCEITTDNSGATLIVPVEAVQKRGSENYVYLAASGSSAGQEFESAQVNLQELKTVTVKTGMSDGLYISITGDIKAGDLVMVPVLTTTEDGSSAEQTDVRSFGGQGMIPGMDGGGMPRQQGSDSSSSRS